MIRSILRLGLAAALVPIAAAHAQCPPSHVHNFYNGQDTPPIVAASYTDSLCKLPPPYFCERVWRAGWSLTAGDAFCQTASACNSEIDIVVGDAGPFTSDDYVLTGPSSPNPVSFSAVLHISGSSTEGCHTVCYEFPPFCQTTCSFGRLEGSLAEGAQVVQASTNADTAAFNRNLELPLSKNVGDHFQLDMMLRASAPCGGLVQITSHLSFVLPPGYAIQSCYGYRTAGPTPIARMSWGRVKSLYR